MTCSLAVVILTFNEARHISRALKSVESFASQVFIIDCGSTDGTLELARAAGAVTLYHPWSNHARQFQWGLDNAPIVADWVMRLDADEIIEPELATEISTRLARLPAEVTGVNLKRKHIFMGRWIRHGGRYPVTLLRIWRRGKARAEQRWMDEHILLTEGVAVTFDQPFSDHNLNDLTHFTSKHNGYATLEAIEVLNRKYDLFSSRGEELSSRSASVQAAAKRWVKENLYGRLPYWLAAAGYFFYRYVIQGGFLDGREGLIYHSLQGGWYRFLVGAKVVEYDRVLAGLSDRQSRIEALSRMTGHKLSTTAEE